MLHHYTISAGDRFSALLDVVHAFSNEFRSALYLPLVMAVHSIRCREGLVLRGSELVRSIEERTGHGSWGSGRFEVEERDEITESTAQLRRVLNKVGNTTR